MSGKGTPWNPAAAHLGIVHQASARNTNFLVQKFYRTSTTGLSRSCSSRMRIWNGSVRWFRNIPTFSDGRHPFDSVIERREQLDPPQWPEGSDKDPVRGGQYWPRDEECIYPVLRKALEQSPELQLVLVPHEPTEEHLLRTETFFRGIPMVRWKDGTSPAGIADPAHRLHRPAHRALPWSRHRVGAGFTTGVHNTMEPASMGLPSSSARVTTMPSKPKK